MSWILLACFPLACGGKSENGPSGTGGTTGGTGGTTGGTGGATGGTGGATGGTGGVTPACEVATSQAPPYATKIRFTTAGSQTLYLVDSCQLEYSLYACSDGYTETLSRSGACTIDCSDPAGGCIACGACAYLAKPVTAALPIEDDWSGIYFTYAQTPDGCSCHTGHPAPPQKYRVTADVYASEDDLQNNVVLRKVSADFELPAPSGVVEVSVD